MFKAIASIFAVVILATSAHADLANSTINATKPLLAVSIAAAYLSDTKDESIGLNRAARTLDGILVSGGVAELMKGATKSFPSGHATVAFAAASSLSHVFPKQKGLWYGAASLLGWSLVKTHNHSLVEVLGGAALGTSVGNLSMSSDSGLLCARIKF
jgi:membrane-associated phospholipid phosphatase